MLPGCAIVLLAQESAVAFEPAASPTPAAADTSPVTGHANAPRTDCASPDESGVLNAHTQLPGQFGQK